MSLTDSFANASLDALLGSTTLLGSTVYVGLMLAIPNPDGTGVVEPSGGAYARVAVTNDSTHWPAATARAKTHASNIVFPQATGNWGTIICVGIFSALTSGTLKLYDLLNEQRAYLSGDQFSFVAGGPLALKFFA
jgi:hypothetical protein